jgi:hypothetical protein
MNLAIYFLALIGLIVILIIIYRFSKVSSEGSQKSGVVKNWPPRQYMNNVGKYCPDYWTYVGVDPTDPKKHICKNNFNVDVRTDLTTKPAVCYSNLSAKQKTFITPILTDDGIEKGDALNAMCAFIRDCGPRNSLNASWLGINTSNGWAVCP